MSKTQGPDASGWPSNEELWRIARHQNPWHHSGVVPSWLAPETERWLVKLVTEGLTRNTLRRFQVVLGPRRVGKTTAMHQVVRRLISSGTDPRRIWWFRLDHPALSRMRLGTLMEYALSNSTATREHPLYLMLDEVAHSDDWQLWLKSIYDDHWPVRVAATSSASTALARGRIDSGIGRWEEHHLTPYSLTELCALRGVDTSMSVGSSPPGESLRNILEDIFRSPLAPGAGDFEIERQRKRLILLGGFPELQTQEPAVPPDFILHSQELARAEAALDSDTIDRVIYRDITSLYDIGDPITLRQMLMLLADQVTGIFSPRSISQDLGVTHPTVAKYLSYLEQSFLVFTLPNFSAKERKVRRRGKKLFFVDSAVRNAALLRSFQSAVDAEEMGKLMENLVAGALRRIERTHRGARLYYWRSGNLEVDFVLDDPRGPVAIEIGSSAKHSKRGLLSLAERYPQIRGGCYLSAPQAPLRSPRTTSDGIGAIPLDALLLAIDQAGRPSADPESGPLSF